jgi:inosine-uridine nucleoside N-ribohydrolase
MERIIIDTDPGVDDAHAIMMAVAYPGVKVEALTAVAGNVGLEHTVANACTILDMLDADIPVYAGCDRAMVYATENAAHVHGEDGLGDVGFPPSRRTVEPEHAAAALVRLANDSPSEIILVAIGPLTNVAVALKLDPDLPRKFKQLVVMGGAINAHGNTTNASAEFNAFADPEAAYVVLEAWPELTLVSWETTMAHPFPAQLVEKWMALESPKARFFQRITTKIIDFITELRGEKMLFGADGLAMAVALEPNIVTKAEKRYVTMELNGRYTRGQTTVDWLGRSGQPPNVNIILEVDHDRFIELMEMGLR